MCTSESRIAAIFYVECVIEGMAKGGVIASISCTVALFPKDSGLLEYRDDRSVTVHEKQFKQSTGVEH